MSPSPRNTQTGSLAETSSASPTYSSMPTLSETQTQSGSDAAILSGSSTRSLTTTPQQTVTGDLTRSATQLQPAAVSETISASPTRISTLSPSISSDASPTVTEARTQGQTPSLSGTSSSPLSIAGSTTQTVVGSRQTVSKSASVFESAAAVSSSHTRVFLASPSSQAQTLSSTQTRSPALPATSSDVSVPSPPALQTSPGGVISPSSVPLNVTDPSAQSREGSATIPQSSTQGSQWGASAEVRSGADSLTPSAAASVGGGLGGALLVVVGIAAFACFVLRRRRAAEDKRAQDKQDPSPNLSELRIAGSNPMRAQAAGTGGAADAALATSPRGATATARTDFMATAVGHTLRAFNQANPLTAPPRAKAPAKGVASAAADSTAAPSRLPLKAPLRTGVPLPAVPAAPAPRSSLISADALMRIAAARQAKQSVNDAVAPPLVAGGDGVGGEPVTGLDLAAPAGAPDSVLLMQNPMFAGPPEEAAPQGAASARAGVKLPPLAPSVRKGSSTRFGSVAESGDDRDRTAWHVSPIAPRAGSRQGRSTLDSLGSVDDPGPSLVRVTMTTPATLSLVAESPGSHWRELLVAESPAPLRRSGGSSGSNLVALGAAVAATLPVALPESPPEPGSASESRRSRGLGVSVASATDDVQPEAPPRLSDSEV